MDERFGEGLVCVDPAVGEQILDLDLPTLDAGRRGLLEAHLGVCASCRLTTDIHHHLQQRLRAGSGPGRRRGPDPSRWCGWLSAAAAAACLACLLTLPPRPAGPAGTSRGADSVRFLRPVEGEVVGLRDLRVAWTPVEGADGYRVRLVTGDAAAGWSAASRTPSLVVPAAGSLEPGTAYRLVLAVEPADLLPPGGVSVGFRTGGLRDVAVHRVVRARPAVYGLAAACLILAALAAVQRRSRPVPAVAASRAAGGDR